MLAMLLPVVALRADAGGTVPDQLLVGQWQGTNRFFGMSHEEIAENKVAARSMAAVLQISTDGTVTGRIGGAELSGCFVVANRGWLGRLLHVKTDFIIRGTVVGAVAPRLGKRKPFDQRSV